MERRLSARDDRAAYQRIVIRSNRSLSSRGIVRFLVLYAAVAGMIAAALWRAGAWLVAPFFGAELVMVAVLCWWLGRHRGDREVVICGEDSLRIIKHRAGKTICHGFSRYWASVNLRRSAGGWYPSQLLVGSHGHFVEVGSNITEQARQDLAADMKAMVSGSRQHTAICRRCYAVRQDLT